MARELGLPFSETLTIGFLLYLFFGLGAPLAGWATDRFGGRSVLIVCLLGGGISGAVVAFSDTLLMTQIGLGGLGLAASLYHPAGLALLSLHFEKVGRAFALNGMAGNIGIAATPFVAGLLAAIVGWRYAYLFICAPALLFGVIFLLLPFDDAPPPARVEVETRFDWRPIALFSVAIIAGGLAYRLHTLVVPALLQERFPWLAEIEIASLSHVDNLAATLLTSAAYAMGCLGSGSAVESPMLIRSRGPISCSTCAAFRWWVPRRWWPVFRFWCRSSSICSSRLACSRSKTA